MKTMRTLLRVGPFMIIIVLLGWIYISSKSQGKSESIINRTTILDKIETLGKLELVKYQFKEVTELTEISKEYFDLFKLGPDSKIALISTGYAVGCIDLTLIKKEDVNIDEETIYIQLPAPELCYYKLDLDKTRIFSLQTNPLKDESDFIQTAYKNAEKEIEAAALASGILEQTSENARLILKPLIENLSGKSVVFSEKQVVSPF